MTEPMSDEPLAGHEEGAPPRRIESPAPMPLVHPDDAAVTAVRTWLEGADDGDLVELEARTLRGVLALLDGWRRNAETVRADRNAIEDQLAETSADGAQWQSRAETAERKLAEIGEMREEWACQYMHGDLMRGFESEADVRSTAYPGVTVYHRVVGEWRDDTGNRAYPAGG